VVAAGGVDSRTRAADIPRKSEGAGGRCSAERGHRRQDEAGDRAPRERETPDERGVVDGAWQRDAGERRGNGRREGEGKKMAGLDAERKRRGREMLGR